MITYKEDVAAWSLEQAGLLRAGRFDMLDVLQHRMAILLAHLLKWHYQPERRGGSLDSTIKKQRKRVLIRLKEMPSLKSELADPDWVEGVWKDAVVEAIKETGLDEFSLEVFPEACPWVMAEVLTEGWLPNDL